MRIPPKAVAFAVPLCIIGCWDLSLRLGVLSPVQAASPKAVIERFAVLLTSPEFLLHALISLRRLAIAFLLGAVTGTLSGAALARTQWADLLLSPTLQFLAPIPIIVWLPFLIMFLGLGEGSKIILIAMAVFFIVHFHAFQSVKSTERVYLEVATMYQKSGFQRFREVLLPAAAPNLFAAFRVTLGLAWVVLFIAEYAYATEKEGGLGWYIANAKGFGQIENQLAGVLMLGAIAFGVDLLMSQAERRLLRWRFEVDGSASRQ